MHNNMFGAPLEFLDGGAWQGLPRGSTEGGCKNHPKERTANPIDGHRNAWGRIPQKKS